MAAISDSAAQTTQQHRDWCERKGNPSDEQVVAGCDAIINATASLPGDRTLNISYFNRGLAHRRLGNHRLALKSFDYAIEADPNDADAYVSRGNTRYDLREFDRAVADFSEAIRLNPNHGLAFKNRSAAYASLGDINRAIADIKTAAALGVKD